MASSEGQPPSYPSPKQNALPFYHEDRTSTAPREAEPEQSQDSSRILEHGERRTDTGHSALDDQELHHHLTSAMSEDMHNQHGYENMQSVFSVTASPAPGPAQATTSHTNPRNTASPGPSPATGSKKDRSKTSRACDECRRKKIRCDAGDESGTVACTNCARIGSSCAFTREPRKRGPSKGYIKELADRLNSLEQQVGPSPPQYQARSQLRIIGQALDEINASTYNPVESRAGEKRTRDMLEAVSAEPSPSRMRTEPRTLVSQAPPYPPVQQHSLENGVQPGSAAPFWSRGQEQRRDTVGIAFEPEPETAITNFDWDEDVVAEYYRIIHQTFPLLPNNKTRLRQRLAECPSTLRSAFLAALDCLMRTFPTTVLQPNANYPQALKRAAELLAKYPFENPSSHTNATNLVYLQTLLLMALETDNHGPATIRGQAGPSRAEWLGRAAGVAGQLEINVIRSSSQSVIAGDPDSEERLARRVWWVLFILDRWHASSTADLLKLPENSVVLLPEDQILLGESTYHLARLSFIIGHLAAILTTTKTPSTDVMARANPASSLLVLTLAGEIDRFRESVESVWGSLNLVHVSYHHCHLLIKRLSPECAPTELVDHAVKVATVLNSRLTPVTPLNHHFGALAAMTLCELCDVPQTRNEAVKGLDAMIEALGEGRGLAGKLDSDGWDGAVRELVKKKKERLSSSDAANRAEDTARFDPTMLTRYGYLTALGQGLFRSN